MSKRNSAFSGFISNERRVLIVTTNCSIPPINTSANGMTIVSDLTGAGYPFDVVTYDRFVHLKFDGSDHHDVIFLNGHPSPVSVRQVASKSKEVIAAGRKIFINGNLPYIQYDENGNINEKIWFCQTLFNLNLKVFWGVGKARIPKAFEKDPIITQHGQALKRIQAFHFKAPPEIQICLGRHIIGFMTSTGGAMNGSSDYFLNLLDYAKVVGYLRWGTPEIVGFANDRIQGRPIVSIEVHCDATRDLNTIDNLEQVVNDFQIPLSNLLVLSRATDKSIQKWNAVSQNPLMIIGSHSRTHPMNWTKVDDFLNETTEAITDQKKIISQTGCYFNFSGGMNPTQQQVELLYTSGIVFGARGGSPRTLRLPFGGAWKNCKGLSIRKFIWRVLNHLFSPLEIQLMPTCESWFELLSRSNTTPFCLSQTLWSDYGAYKGKKMYADIIKTAFLKNMKYGMYSYGLIHDYAFDAVYKKLRTNGIFLADQIFSALSFFKVHNAFFMPTELLIRRLWDFLGGWIDYEMLSPDKIQVTVYRAQALANQVKIEGRHQQRPVASGHCVLAQKMIGNMLYVDLNPEVKSTFNVDFL